MRFIILSTLSLLFVHSAFAQDFKDYEMQNYSEQTVLLGSSYKYITDESNSGSNQAITINGDEGHSFIKGHGPNSLYANITWSEVGEYKVVSHYTNGYSPYYHDFEETIVTVVTEENLPSYEEISLSNNASQTIEIGSNFT